MERNRQARAQFVNLAVAFLHLAALDPKAPVMSMDLHQITKALTLKSSWLASALLHGKKPFENRSQQWSSGWYAVHVGVSKDGDDWAEKHVRDCCETDEDVAFVAADVHGGLLPRGAIVGFCRIAHVLPPEACNGSPWALGPYCHVISQTAFLSTPLENVRGQLGLWTMDAPTQCRLSHHAGRNAIRTSMHVQQFPADPRALVRARARLLEEKRAAKRRREEPEGATVKQLLLPFPRAAASLRSGSPLAVSASAAVDQS